MSRRRVLPRCTERDDSGARCALFGLHYLHDFDPTDKPGIEWPSTHRLACRLTDCPKCEVAYLLRNVEGFSEEAHGSEEGADAWEHAVDAAALRAYRMALEQHATPQVLRAWDDALKAFGLSS